MLLQIPVLIGIIKLVFRNMNQNAFQEIKPSQWIYEWLAVTGGKDRSCYKASLYSPLNIFLILYSIVIKATTSQDNDCLLLVVEIKPPDKLEGNAVEQLTEYMGMLADKHHHNTKEPLFTKTFYGLLILGDHVRILSLPLNSTMGLSRHDK